MIHDALSLQPPPPPHPTRSALRTMFVSTLMLGLAGGAWAQEASGDADEVETIAEAEGPGVVWTLDVGTAFRSEVDFDTNVGTIDSFSYGGKLGILFPVDDRARLLVSFGIDVTDYDITPTVGAVGTTAATVGTQFDTVTEYGADLLYTRAIDAKRSFFVGGGIGVAAEGGASDALVWNGVGGFAYQVNDKLRIGGGIGVHSQLEDDLRIVPLPQIHFTIDDRWSIQSKGIGGKINYKWNDEVNMGVMGQFEGQSFRINSDNTLVPNGSVSVTGLPLSYYLEYSGGEQSQISIFAQVGMVILGQMEILTSTGTSVVDEGVDAGVFGSVGVKIKF